MSKNRSLSARRVKARQACVAFLMKITVFINLNLNGALILESTPESVTTTFNKQICLTQCYTTTTSPSRKHALKSPDVDTQISTEPGSLHIKFVPTALCIPHLIRAEHEGDVEMGWHHVEVRVLSLLDTNGHRSMS